MYTQLGATVTEGETGICFLLVAAWTSKQKPGPLLPLATLVGEPLVGGDTPALSPCDPVLISHFCVHT